LARSAKGDGAAARSAKGDGAAARSAKGDGAAARGAKGDGAAARSAKGSGSAAHDARAVALDVITRVRTEDAYANLALPAALSAARLTGRDAGLATELVSGTLRMQGAYDAVIDQVVPKSPRPRVRDILRMGAHQLLSMRIPDHAAVSATVALAKQPERGFVNAVLRKIAARTLDEWLAGRDLATRYSHPRWVVDALAEAVGGDEIEALLAADNLPPRVVLVARPGRAAREELPGEPTAYSPYGVVLAGGSPGEVPAVAEGRAGVQDEGSQLVAIVAANAPLTGRDERWLDLCAGPGGKSALLAALAAERGAGLTANEAQPHRAGLVRQNVSSDGGLVDGAVGVVAGDGNRPPFAPGTFDRVLVDAPCTGLGALRRRPEARWRRRPEDLEVLVPLQQSLLTSALELVRPGGVVTYSTCSPVLAETKFVIETILNGRSDLDLLDVGPLLPNEEVLGGAGSPLSRTAQLWPHRHGTDAMFIAVLRRQ